MSWPKVLKLLELKVLAFLRRTIKGNFFCDSRPRLCVNCKRLRFFLKVRKMPNFIIINTVHGLYVWNNSNARVTVAW